MQITGEADLPIAKEIYDASDRGAAILATSWLDEHLTAALRSKLFDDKDTANKLFKPSGPLGNLVPKAEMGYLLKLYSKGSRDDLVHIAGVRNMFAHWTDQITFGSREIRLKCESLTLVDRIFANNPEHEPKKRPFSAEIARDEFLNHVGAAASLLNWIATTDVQDPHTKW